MQYVLQWVVGGPLSCALLAPCAGCGSGSTIAVPYSVGAVLFSVCAHVRVRVCICMCIHVLFCTVCVAGGRDTPVTTTHHAEQVCQCVEQQLCSVSVHIRKGLVLASADELKMRVGGWCLQSGHSSAFLLRSSPPPHGCLGDNCSCTVPHTLSIIAAN